MNSCRIKRQVCAVTNPDRNVIVDEEIVLYGHIAGGKYGNTFTNPADRVIAEGRVAVDGWVWIAPRAKAG